LTDRAFRQLARTMPAVADRIREACRERSQRLQA
jgi:hypothetical protein